MRKVLLAGAALLALGAVNPAMAQDRAAAGAAVGATTGAATGATAGFFLGGPLGAVIGGFTGAAVGSQAGISSTSMDYVSRHPVQPVDVGTDFRVGARLGPDVTIYPIQGDRRHGYIYANGRAYIVNLGNRQVLASPGYAIPQRSVDYAMRHRSGAAKLKGSVAVGYKVPANVSLTAIPSDNSYSYVYINGKPALVDNSTHVLVWMGG
ncbi:MAG: hypothetical protein JWN11_70 [Hyphomicrobiales bacterium]|nr:hypothetical protein [Hyphomicrobiales bacterium]